MTHCDSNRSGRKPLVATKPAVDRARTIPELLAEAAQQFGIEQRRLVLVDFCFGHPQSYCFASSSESNMTPTGLLFDIPERIHCFDCEGSICNSTPLPSG